MTDFTSEGKRGFRIWNAICCVLPRFRSRESRRESAIPSNTDTPNTSDRAFLLVGYREFLMAFSMVGCVELLMDYVMVGSGEFLMVISMVIVESCCWLLMVLGCCWL